MDHASGGCGRAIPDGAGGGGAHFHTFVEDEHHRLFKALYFLCGSRENAEDLAQEAFLRLWERWDKIDAIDDPTAYLFRVALNAFRMRRRRAAMPLRDSDIVSRLRPRLPTTLPRMPRRPVVAGAMTGLRP